VNGTPLGNILSYCPRCGSDTRVETPGGDDMARYVCTDCGTVLYENPKPVVGCVTEHEGRILLCKRAIKPQLGFWTVPAGFMELGENLGQAALRETREEACAEVTLGSMLAVVDVVQAGQVHIFFRGKLATPEFAAGDESLDVRLYAPEEIPWDEIAFSSGHIALKQFLEQRAAGVESVHYEVAPTNRL
jgi:ADP-ribose pyrophosphatase YjhB (NUDIX family)